MKICFLKSNSLVSGGGAENWLINASRRLIERHEVSIVGLKYAEVRRLNPHQLASALNGIKYYEFPSVKPPRGVPIPAPFSIKHMLELFNSCDLTYVIVPEPPTELLFYLLKRNIKSKLIAGFHGFLRSDVLLKKLYTPIFKKTLSAFDAYHVLNNETYNWLKKMGYYNSFFIPNGVDTKLFQLCEKPSHARKFNVLFAGRLNEDKGVDILVKIIRDANEKLDIQNIEFTIAGSGPLEDVIKGILNKYKNVHYLNFVSPETLPKIYENAHLLLVPSRTEGMPSSLLEAQSCGLPALGSKIPGILDVILNGKTGRLINAGDVRGFADAIKDYYDLWYSSPDEYHRMNKDIREYAVKNYDWDIIISRLEKMFKWSISQDKDVRG